MDALDACIGPHTARGPQASWRLRQADRIEYSVAPGAPPRAAFGRHDEVHGGGPERGVALLPHESTHAGFRSRPQGRAIVMLAYWLAIRCARTVIHGDGRAVMILVQLGKVGRTDPRGGDLQ